MNVHVARLSLPRVGEGGDIAPQLLHAQELECLFKRLNLHAHTNPAIRVIRLFPRRPNGSVIEVATETPSGTSKYFVETGLDQISIAQIRKRQQKQSQRLGQTQPALVFDEDAGICVRPWGIDEAIDGLAAHDLRSWLQDKFPSSEAAALEVSRASVIAHRLNRRAVIKTSNQDGTASYVKLYKKGSAKAERATQVARLLQCTAFGNGSPATVAQIVCGLDGWPGFVMKPAPGQLLTLQSGEQAFALAGEALARLHRLPLRTDTTHAIDDEVLLMAEWVNRVTVAFPVLARQYLSSLARVERELRTGTVEVTLVHRDYHMGQVLVEGSSCTILDFDTLSNGESAQDIGNFLAHLEWTALLEASDCAAQKKAFIERYEHSHRATDHVRCAAHRNATLLRLACIHVFATQFRDAAPRLLELMR